MTNTQPSAAEIEAAIELAADIWATRRMSAANQSVASLSHVLLHLHATIASLTARAEAAEAGLAAMRREVDSAVRVNEALNTEIEALAARVATLEAALREAEDMCGNCGYVARIVKRALASKLETKP